MRHVLALLPVLALGACMEAPPPAAAPPEVSALADVSLAALPAGVVGQWLGQWRSGARTMTISRSGDTLYAAESGAPAQALKLVGLGTFADAAGTSYLFVPPASGARLDTVSSAGASTSWSR